MANGPGGERTPPGPFRSVDPGAPGPDPRDRPRTTQKVSLKLLILPVSCAAMSWTLSFQAPFATSDEALTV
ncbi:hypothetical protein Sfulv_43180 [Streptomyces fulvorobeus]|uniref:Uncharacterized protein n=1 Tax=Streptomyces fulvorobeus TaxID=284028 RepID=A0A7J0CBD0_9ACTN|nr:hypothetical protein Sfulv_43180 [Streptomyces fulvorobeus]